ncbi:MAG: LacI family transcriptional regulator [Chloroflexi bacterium]|nr:LacI family transcriptional regulator [Chloroflexota bacterium]
MSTARRGSTISDVADRAGVSASTVSRHLHGDAVRQGEAIDSVIKILGFRPSRAAQSLRSGRTGSIALVVPDITNPFFAAVVRGAESASAAEGFTVFLSNTEESPEREAQVIDNVLGRVDGIILAPASEDDQNPATVHRAGVPLVFIDCETTGSPVTFDTILVDNRRGAREAVEHLAALGHRDIAIVSGPLGSTPGRERYEGFMAAMDDAGLPVPDGYVAFGGFKERGGHQAMLRLLGQTRPPTAVFVGNNLMTIGALHAIHELAVPIPDALSVVGFDDHVFADLLHPGLTVVERPMEEQGVIAMRLLLNRIAGRVDAQPRRIVLDTTLRVRGSTAPPSPTAAMNARATRHA